MYFTLFYFAKTNCFLRMNNRISQLLAFLRPTLSPWQQRLVVARRTSASGPFGTPVQMPWYHSGVISGSVAVSSMADSSGEFVIGVGGEP